MRKQKNIDWANFPKQLAARAKLSLAWNVPVEAIKFSDANWSVLNDDLLEALEANDAENFRRARVGMVRQLVSEGKIVDAKKYVPECIYLFYAIRWNDEFYSQLGIEPPTFFPTPELYLIMKIGYAEHELKRDFFRETELSYWKQKLPSPSEAIWDKFSADLSDYVSMIDNRTKKSQRRADE